MKSTFYLLSVTVALGLGQIPTLLAQTTDDGGTTTPQIGPRDAVQPAPAAREAAAREAAAREAAAREAAASQAAVPEATGDAGELRFNFSGTNWPAVLQWFADQADLSLQLDQVPIGSFTFADPTRSYTISESLDVINLALMKRGYAVVRRGRMLQVIDLEDENANKLISEIAEPVLPEQLEQRGKSDIVSCVMPLGSLAPEDAREELAQLVGRRGVALGVAFGRRPGGVSVRGRASNGPSR